MKKWSRKIKDLGASTRGETLIESLASLFVMSILMLAVTTMIQTSLKMTGVSIEDAKRMQDSVNAAIMAVDGTTADITFESKDARISISSTHQVKLSKDNGIIAFEPEDTP